MSDQNQVSFICVKKSDANRISANVFVIRAERLDTPWHCESYVTENAAWALIRPRLVLLRLNMQIVSFCSTLLKPNRKYDVHTLVVSRDLTLYNFSGILQSASFAYLTLYLVSGALKSAPRTVQTKNNNPTRMIYCTP